MADHYYNYGSGLFQVGEWRVELIDREIVFTHAQDPYFRNTYRFTRSSWGLPGPLGAWKLEVQDAHGNPAEPKIDHVISFMGWVATHFGADWDVTRCLITGRTMAEIRAEQALNKTIE